ncbi:uncharacterized protein ACB058_015638 [Synchiropus picturatus]
MTRRGKSQLEKLLQCPVCRDIFNKPSLLPCGHSVCESCVESMLDHSSTLHFRCPECRCAFGQAFGLKKNFALAGIAEDYMVTRAQAKEVRERNCPQTWTSETSRALQSQVTDYMEQQCRTLRDQLRESNMLIERLREDVCRQQGLSPVDSFLTVITVVLFLLWVIVLYYVFSYSEQNEKLAETLKRYKSQVEEFCSTMTE